MLLGPTPWQLLFLFSSSCPWLSSLLRATLPWAQGEHDRFAAGLLDLGFGRVASRGQSVDAALTVLALLGSVLVSYTRARAEGLGLECKVGIMTRAERVLLVALGLMSGLLPEAVYLLVALTAFSAMQRIVYAFRQLNPQG